MQNSSRNKWSLHGGALSFGGLPTWTYEREHDEKTCETSMVNLIQFIRFVSVWMRRGNLSDRNPKRSWREMEYHFLVSVCLFIWRSFTRENGFKSSDSSDARVKCDVKKNCVSRINTARSSYQLKLLGRASFLLDYCPSPLSDWAGRISSEHLHKPANENLPQNFPKSSELLTLR